MTAAAAGSFIFDNVEYYPRLRFLFLQNQSPIFRSPSIPSATMIEYTDYQKVFPPGAQMPYDRKRIHEIEARRKELGGQLFIDRVLKALGISKSQFG